MNVCLFLRARRFFVVLLLTAIAASQAAAQSLPSGWTATDIGKVIEPGSTTYAGDTFSITGSGGGVTGASDQFRFIYRSLTGNGTIIARMARRLSLSTDRVGLTLRDSLARGARTVVIDVTGASRLELRHRAATDGASALAASGSGAAPTWLRLDRQGSTITASQSDDGATWRPVGSVNVALNDTLLVGMSVASSWDTAAQTLISNVTVSSGSTTPPPATPPPTTPGNTPPTVSLTTPSNGATYGVPGTITVSATASDANGSVAGVDFYANGARIGTDMSSPYSYTWTGVPAGQYSLTAIARDNAGAATTSAARAVTVTSSSTSNTPPVVSLTTPSSGATFNAPGTVTISATASDPDGAVANVDFYAGSTRISTDLTSPYSYTWTGVPAGQYVLTAVARDSSGATTTSTSRSVTVGAANPPNNTAPNVSLTTPLSGATFNAPGTVTVAATASDSDGTVTSVEFYAGDARIGTDMSSPYAYTWTGVPAGQYSLTAVARDNAGGMTVSGTVMVTVASSSTARTAVFVPSSNHVDAVDRYVIDFYTAGSNPNTANAVGTIDVGKPAVVSGECRADVGTVIQGLAAGQYFATITALGSGGQARSAPSATFTR